MEIYLAEFNLCVSRISVNLSIAMKSTTISCAAAIIQMYSSYYLAHTLGSYTTNVHYPSFFKKEIISDNNYYSSRLLRGIFRVKDHYKLQKGKGGATSERIIINPEQNLSQKTSGSNFK